MACGDKYFSVLGIVYVIVYSYMCMYTIYVPVVFSSSVLLDNGVTLVKYQNLCQCFFARKLFSAIQTNGAMNLW